jgi:hypothetical protein
MLSRAVARLQGSHSPRPKRAPLRMLSRKENLAFFGNPLVAAIVNAPIGAIIVLLVVGLLRRA